MDSKRSKSAHEGILRDHQKCDRGGQKTVKNFVLPIFVKRPIKPLGKLFRTQKIDCKNLFSELQELEVRIKFGRAARTSIDKSMVQKCPELTKVLPRYNINAMHKAFFCMMFACTCAPSDNECKLINRGVGGDLSLEDAKVVCQYKLRPPLQFSGIFRKREKRRLAAAHAALVRRSRIVLSVGLI